MDVRFIQHACSAFQQSEFISCFNLHVPGIFRERVAVILTGHMHKES